MLTALGKKFRILRINNGELLKDMADKLSITPAYLSSIENGKRTPQKSIINKILDCYQLNEDEAEALFDAYYDTIHEVQLNFAKASESQKNLSLVFARKFDNLSSNQVNDIMKILNGKGDSKS